MNKRLTLIAVATLTGLVAFAGTATAQNDFNYSCKKGAVTVKSKTPCYVSAYGISVPGGHDAADAGGKGKDAQDKKGGANKGGPKDLKDKPKGGMNDKGPKDKKS